MTQSLNKPRRCTKCGTPLGGWMSASVCPACMLSSTAVIGATPNEKDPIADGGALAPGPLPPGPGGEMRFGDYVLEKEIAHGGMGVVYRARQVNLDRTVAIKLLLLGRYSSGESIKRFQREAQSIGALRHPGIVTVHEVGECEGQHYIAMEFVDGPTLHELLRDGPLAARRAAEITRDVARAVHYAHQHGVLHRDLKPSNVLLDSSGFARITDFGLAKKLDGSSDLTLTAQLVGTPNYLSPEQAAGRQSEMGPASDVYAMGALLYELITGRPPFLADSLQETLLRIRDAEPVSPRALNPALGRDLETICLKCLEKEPSRRYASAEALANDLERWLRHEPITARPTTPVERFGKWIRRNPATAALLLIAGLATLGFLVGQTISSARLTRANRNVQASNLNLRRSLYDSRWRQADDAARAEERSEAIAWFAYFLRENPSNSVAAARLLSVLSSHNFPLLLHPPLAHEARVSVIDFSRTGDRLATGTAGKTARLWSVQSGQLESELAHPARVTHCFLGGDGDRRLLTISAEPKARLWDLTSRQIIKEVSLGPVNDRVVLRQVLRTRDRGLMAVNLESNVVAVLDTKAGNWVSPRLSQPAAIYNFAMSEDGRLLATGSRSEVQLWDARSNQAMFPPVELSSPPASLCFSDNGHWLACLSKGKVWVMNTVTGRREREFEATGGLIAFVGNGEHLITAESSGGSSPNAFNFRTGQDCGSPFGRQEFDWRQASLAALRFSSINADRIQLLDPSNGRPQMDPFFHDGWIVDAKLHPDGRTVATASDDRMVRIWSVEMGRAEPMTLDVGGVVWEAQWSPSGEKILSTSGGFEESGELRLWDAISGAALIPARKTDSSAFVAAWAPDGSRFATVSYDLTARLWSGRTGEAISPPLRHGGPLDHCAFSPDGDLLATAATDGVRFWEGHTGKAVGALVPYSSGPFKINFSRDGHRFATGSQDGTIRVCSVPEGKLLLGPLHHDAICWGTAFSPDDRLLVSASSDGTARLWDAATGQPVLPPFRHESPVFGANFSPNGKAIATSTESGLVRVWSVTEGQLLSGPMRHPGRVWSVRWSPDGQFLATVCTDGSARIWDALSGHLVAEPFAHEKGKEVRRALFSPDGRRLLTASYDGKVKVWDLVFLRPPVPVPDWLPDLAEALAGKRIGAKDAAESVSGDSFQRVRQRISRARESNDYYARWARWMLEERLERPVKPFRP